MEHPTEAQTSTTCEGNNPVTIHNDKHTSQGQPGHDGGHPGHWVEIKVFAPRDPEERVFVFERSTTVGDAAKSVAEAFGYAPGNHTFQTRHDEVLDRSLTLAAAHVHDQQLLELVDVGGGV